MSPVQTLKQANEVQHSGIDYLRHFVYTSMPRTGSLIRYLTLSMDITEDIPNNSSIGRQNTFCKRGTVVGAKGACGMNLVAYTRNQNLALLKGNLLPAPDNKYQRYVACELSMFNAHFSILYFIIAQNCNSLQDSSGHSLSETRW